VLGGEKQRLKKVIPPWVLAIVGRVSVEEDEVKEREFERI